MRTPGGVPRLWRGKGVLFFEIYLDNAATTKPCQAAVAAMTAAMTDNWGNPSAVHGRGLRAEKAVKAARGQVAEALGCDPERVFFTSGGTEGDNFAAFSVAKRYGKRGRHIITTQVEHHAMLHPMAALEEQGFTVTYLKPQADGSISKADLLGALQKDTILVSVMMVNNETGAVNDIAGMAKLVHQRSQAVFHTDGVQGFLKVPFRASALGADLITVSAHKIGGPKGCGAVYVDKGLHLPPYLYGGGQEKNQRSGTENVPGIVGFGAACEAASRNLREKLRVMEALKAQCLAGIAETVPEAQVLGGHQAPHILSLAVPGVRSQGLIGALEAQGIYVSAGSACSRGHRSHVLEAMDLDPALIDGSIRVSLSFDTTKEDIQGFVTGLRQAVDQLT
jgi:cysteine desulfurase